MGFLLMSIFMAVLGFRYQHFRGDKCDSNHDKEYRNGHPFQFILFYGLTLFFTNFGPNSTTFILPAELFPAQFRTTCHGISTAAILGAFWIQTYTQKDNGRQVAIIALTVVNMLGLLFTFLVPETKGKSLEEISKDYNNHGHSSGSSANGNGMAMNGEAEMV